MKLITILLLVCTLSFSAVAGDWDNTISWEKTRNIGVFYGMLQGITVLVCLSKKYGYIPTVKRERGDIWKHTK